MYKFTQGYRPPKGVDAETAAKELAAIRKRRGMLTPADVVDASRSADAPLHRCFEWDDSKAGELYRHSQASTLVRAVVVIESSKGDYNQFTLVVKDNQRQYIETIEVANDDMLFVSAHRELMRHLEGCAESLRRLEMLRDVKKAAKLRLVQKSVQAAIQAAAEI